MNNWDNIGDREFIETLKKGSKEEVIEICMILKKQYDELTKVSDELTHALGNKNIRNEKRH